MKMLFPRWSIQWLYPVAGVLVAMGLGWGLFRRSPGPAQVAPTPPPPPAPARVWPGIYSVPVSDLPPAEDLPPGTIRILVLGDSVASFLGLAMRYRQEETHTFVAHRGIGECSIFEAKTHIVDGRPVLGTSCSTTWAADVAALRPDATLIVQGGAFFGKQTCDVEFLDAYEQRILSLVKDMGPAAGKVALAIVPYPMDRWRWGTVMDRVDCFDAMLRRTAEKGHLGTVDLMAHVCPTKECDVLSDGQPIRPDGLHFDGKGAEETARWTIRELVSLTKR